MWKQGAKSEPQEERYILCIDGGGMRGVIPAHLLEKASELLREAGDERPFIDHFDLVAGTSTGGLIALGLASPTTHISLPAEEGEPCPVCRDDEQSMLEKLLKRPIKQQLLGYLPPAVSIKAIGDLYRVHGKEIFPKPQAKFLGGIFNDKYDEAPLEAFLDSMFHETPLTEAIIPCMVVSYDAENGGRPYPITSRDSRGFLFKEAGRATSAAPTYFKPAFMNDHESGEPLTLLDGGLIADNPVMYAYREARILYPHCEKFHILSLSTGQARLQCKISRNTGVIGWLDPTQGAPIQKIYTTGIAQSAELFATSNPQIDYTRIDGPLQKQYRLDVTDPEAIAEMEEEAEGMYQAHKDQLSAFIERLKARTVFDQLKLQPTLPVIKEETDHASETTSP